MQQLTLRISNLVQDVNSPFSPDRSPLNFCPSAIHGRSTAATMHPHPHGTRIVLVDIRGRIRNVLRSAKYCDNRVCLSVCLPVCPRAYFRNYTSNLGQFLCTLPMSVARSSSGGDTLCTSGFMDGVIFAHNGPCAVVPE